MFSKLIYLKTHIIGNYFTRALLLTQNSHIRDRSMTLQFQWILIEYFQLWMPLSIRFKILIQKIFWLIFYSIFCLALAVVRNNNRRSMRFNVMSHLVRFCDSILLKIKDRKFSNEQIVILSIASTLFMKNYQNFNKPIINLNIVSKFHLTLWYCNKSYVTKKVSNSLRLYF